MRCWAYIDGFNLYNGILRRTGCKWLNLLALCERLRPEDTVERVKYFTALVERRTDDPDQQRRQRIYWRALDTLGCVERVEGKFRRRATHLPLEESVRLLEELSRRGCDVAGLRPMMVRVLRSEEKGTDVNLAAHLVNDAHAGRFDVALVISTDSDLAGAIRLVTREVGRPVYVCKPDRGARTVELQTAASGIFDLKASALAASLFPPLLVDGRGQSAGPVGWRHSGDRDP